MTRHEDKPVNLSSWARTLRADAARHVPIARQVTTAVPDVVLTKKELLVIELRRPCTH
jgi:hypothetical protein